jgi:hypothetical protein
MEDRIPVQLGGYGARKGKPAEGTLDTIFGKVRLFDSGGEKAALITVDMCSVPICVAEETLKKAGIKDLSLDRLLIPDSPTHAGLEGYSLDRRNVARRSRVRSPTPLAPPALQSAAECKRTILPRRPRRGSRPAGPDLQHGDA